MNELPELREITDDNLFAVARLSDSLSPSQQRCVAPNIYSIAQGLVADAAWFRGIYLAGEPIGFVMVAMHVPPEELPAADQPAAFLWRFMIAGTRQRRGYGTAVLDQVVAMARDRGYRSFYTSCETGEPEGPLDFYLRYGFEDTGEHDDDGEQILRLPLAARPQGYRLALPIAPRVALLTVWTEDLEPMRQFYHGVLGFAEKNDRGTCVELEHPGTRIALCLRSSMCGGAPELARSAVGQRFELSFQCDQPGDVNATYDLLVGHGAHPVTPPLDTPSGGRVARFSDPDGNVHRVFADGAAAE